MPVPKILLIIVSLVPILAAPVYADDANQLHDLEALFDAEIRRMNAGTGGAFAASSHTDVVVFSMFSPLSIVGKDAFQQFMQRYFEQHAEAIFTAVDPRFRIVKTTALAWGFFTLTEPSKDGSLQAVHGRYLLTYTRVEERWTLLAASFTPFESPPAVP